MGTGARATAKQLLRSAGIEISRAKERGPAPPSDPADAFRALVELHVEPGRAGDDDPRWAFVRSCAEDFGRSRAQLFQDLFVLHELGAPRGGYFVEFGATNGVSLSNTHLLEHGYGWDGIVAEPARCWHDDLAANRSCTIDHRCVWATTGERLQFAEVADDPEYSTLAPFTASDHHADRRRASATTYEVETVSLMDLLADHGAPTEIDYLSVDTEGSEHEILAAVDFDRYSFRVITVEHNHTASRNQIFELLTRAGYERRLTELSAWDDWYVRRP